MATHVYLVPGFFGFTSIGALNYFFRVRETLEAALASRGKEARVVECRTLPTGSLRTRAERLLDQVLASGGGEAEAIHFVGHSAGALDVRLLVSPGVRVKGGGEGAEERIGALTKSVITMSAPHHGTPLANFFTTVQGRRVLQLLCLLATCGPGRYTVYQAARLLGVAAELDDVVRRTTPLSLVRRSSLADAIATRALKSLTLSDDDPFWTYLREMASDQGVVTQLTPEGMDLYNAAVTDREGVSYRCLLTAAPPRAPRHLFGLRSASQVATGALFAFVQTVTAREHAHYRYPRPAPAVAAALQRDLPFPLDGGANDGFVAALSQVYGWPIGAVVADHLDVVGQFPDAGGAAGSDWLPSGSGFDEARFRAVWGAVADAIVEAS